MIDAREQVAQRLLAISNNVRMVYPEGDVELPLITYAEVTNVNVGPNHDRLEFQVDGWAGTFDELISLVQQIDSAMTELGYKRTFVTPDSSARQAQDLYHKAMSYRGDVDTKINNFLWR